MLETDDRKIKTEVAEFWDSRPCGSFASDVSPGEKRFFEEVESHRYDAQPFMGWLGDQEGLSGLHVLEVGCGLGSDLRRLAVAGANVVGMDLSARSVSLAQEHFRVFGTQGKFVRGDAESLPFSDASFDIVYSFGVLHHTPDTAGAIEEAYRVLKPGGTLRVMLYNRRSWLARVEPILVVLKRLLLRQRAPVGGIAPSEAVRRYDGDANPLGKAYTPAEVRRMLERFEATRLTICHPRAVGVGRLGYAYSRLLDLSGINRRWGFWIVAEARRPA